MHLVKVHSVNGFQFKLDTVVVNAVLLSSVLKCFVYKFKKSQTGKEIKEKVLDK